MPAHLAKGAIILASVVVAVGIALYESPQFRRWIDQSRRKVAIALHSLGNEIQPRRPSESSEDFAARREVRRQEIIRQERNELVRRAREEGVAVDLDELARIGLDVDDLEMTERNGRGRTNSQRSFDELVGQDGKIRDDEDAVMKASGILLEDSEANLRRRGMAGFAAGSAAAGADPFSDDNMILFDHDNDSRQSSQTIRDTSSDLIDLDVPSESQTLQSQTLQLQLQCPEEVDAEYFAALPADIQQEVIEFYEERRAERLLGQDEKSPKPGSTETSQALSDHAAPQSQADSFYSVASSSSTSTVDHLPATADSQPELIPPNGEETDDDDMAMSAGTLTPRSTSSHRSDYSALTADSLAGHANNSAVQSMMDESDMDARSEAWSEAGFTDAGHSDAGNSGIMTPGSWTDVASDEEGSEWNGYAGAGHVQQPGGQTQ